MKIKNSKFIKGIRGTDKILEEDFLHVAFYGRSNVGKSSSINCLLERKNLVKSSSTPGKTKELNFFEIESDFLAKFFIVDLPGYGYAKISQTEREKLRKLIRWYILDGGVKKRVNILVLDASVGLTDLDKEVLESFIFLKEKIIVLANKSDKLKQKEISKNLKILRQEIPKEIEVINFSAKNKKGIENFWQKVF